MIGHIPHVVEANKHQGLIIPKSFSFNFCPEMVITKAHYIGSSNPTGEKQPVNTESNKKCFKYNIIFVVFVVCHTILQIHVQVCI